MARDAILEAHLKVYENSWTPLVQVIIGNYTWSSGIDLTELRANEK